jgi:hypothetical protein
MLPSIMSIKLEGFYGEGELNSKKAASPEGHVIFLFYF